MHHQLAGAAAIAALVDQRFELGNGVIALLRRAATAASSCFDMWSSSASAPRLVIHALDRGLAAEAGNEVLLV